MTHRFLFYIPRTILILLLISFIFFGCQSQRIKVQKGTSHELLLQAQGSYQNGYTDVECWVQFSSDKGDTLLRPAFWDGGNSWKVRFSPPDSGSKWSWLSFASVSDKGLVGKTGSLESVAYRGENKLLSHGLLKMSPGKRNVVHADGTPVLVVADTPWAIPFRATTDQVEVYALDRSKKGFNTALLLTLQPDRFAEGPEARNTVLGFDRAFEDLPEGHLNHIKPDYFQMLDSFIHILNAKEIIPVYAPSAHGYGWKGKKSMGPQAFPDEYARYCKYLVARYGSMPAIWLISLDGNGHDRGVKPGGETVEQWDAYKQPAGLHYSPWDDFLSRWATTDSSCCFHYNKTYQAEPWLDFQWAQTGHDGLHLYHKVERMYDNLPVKASMDGESTYEAMGDGKLALGWWQGQDAWTQLMHGGTMGVVYGAACLWQWKITADEPGWPAWTNASLSWRDALDLEGSNYVGHIAKAFQGFDYTDMERRWDLTLGNKPLLAKEGIFYVSYLENGGEITIKNMTADLPYHWFDPVAGEFMFQGKTTKEGIFNAPAEKPWVLVIGEKIER